MAGEFGESMMQALVKPEKEIQPEEAQVACMAI